MNKSCRYHLPQSSPCTADDGKCFPCDHRPAIDEIIKEQSLVAQLRAVVLPALETKADELAAIAAQLFGSILDCSRKAICVLQSHYVGESPEVINMDNKRRPVKRKNDEGKMVGDDDEQGKTHQQKRSRRYTNSISHVTPVPHYDGHQWRKYGQKNINNSNHQRSYYRCTYKHEQNCKATKTVQQLENAGETMLYTVVYYGQHTCKQTNMSYASLNVIEASTPQSISTTYSHFGDYGQTLENMNTLEVAEVCSDLGSYHTQDIDQPSTKGLADDQDMQHTLLDIFACGPLDLDIWEIDAILGSANLC